MQIDFDRIQKNVPNEKSNLEFELGYAWGIFIPFFRSFINLNASIILANQIQITSYWKTYILLQTWLILMAALDANVQVFSNGYRHCSRRKLITNLLHISYPLKFFKHCLPQYILSPLLKNLS